MLVISEKEKYELPLLNDYYAEETVFKFSMVDITESEEDKDEDKDKGKDKHKKKKFIARGRMVRGDKVTLNKTKYEAASLESTFIPEYIKNYVNKKKGYGLDGHPGFEGSKPSNASIRILKMWMEGKDVWSDFVVLETIAGKDTQEIIREGGALGISLRGGFPNYESVPLPDKKGVRTITTESGFKFRGFDTVLDASSVGSGVASYKEDVNKQKINNNKGGETMDIRTVEELRAAFPGLVAQLLKEEKGAMLQVVEDKSQTIVKEAIASTKGKEIKESVTLSKEGITCTNCESHMSVVATPEHDKEMEALKTASEDKDKKIETLEKDNSEMKKKEEDAEVVKAMTEHLKDSKHDSYREALIKKMSIPESKEAAIKALDADLAFIAGIPTMKKETGESNFSGITPKQPEGKDGEFFNKEDANTLATLAGGGAE